MTQNSAQQNAQQLLAKLKAIAQLNRNSRLRREQTTRTVRAASS